MTAAPLPSAAEAAVAALREAQATIATAESITGGLVVGGLTSVPGSSAVVLGGVVAYSISVKQRMLGVPAAVLEQSGPVHPDTAMWMALGAARRFGANVTLATTGVAGPEPHGGSTPGQVLFGWWTDGTGGVLQAQLSGDRWEIRAQAVELAMSIIVQCARNGALTAADLGQHRPVETVDHGVAQAELRFPTG
ncbi:MAG: nicotinamide-nucleotide amidohydrolase family protein [Actinomycetia bacterium]|nr:nicotinamide-nucleotide amidohydrolase family protein [Actinomycetes bacterium]MCH9799978.1 nicotinamide-nucleotide amidohydrolase family protein [Actinomycetes bacterium]